MPCPPLTQYSFFSYKGPFFDSFFADIRLFRKPAVLTSFKSLPYKSPCLLFISLLLVEEQKKGGEKVKMYFVVKRACLPSSSLLNMRTVCAPRINEPELEQWQRQKQTCIITLRLTDELALIPYTPWIDHNVSYFLINQSKTKTFTDLEVTRKPARPVKSLENSTWPYLNEIPPHEDRRLWRHRR